MQNKEIIFRLILYAARRFTSIILLFFSIKIIPTLWKEESYEFIERGFLQSRFRMAGFIVPDEAYKKAFEAMQR